MGRYFSENNFGQTNPIIPLFCIQRPIFLLSHSLVCCCFRHRNLGISALRTIQLAILFSDCPTKGPAVWAERSERRRNQRGSADKTGTERLLCADRGARGEGCNRGTRRRAQKMNNITRRRRYADVRGGGGRGGGSEGDETKAERVEREEGEETADSACRWLIIVVIWRGSLSDDETSSSPSPPLLSVSLTRL